MNPKREFTLSASYDSKGMGTMQWTHTYTLDRDVSDSEAIGYHLGLAM